MESPLHQVVTAAEAAEMIGVSKRQIARLCSDGRLENREAPGGLLILKTSVDEYAIHKKLKENVGKSAKKKGD